MCVKAKTFTKVSKPGEYRLLDVHLNGGRIEELDCIRYLGVDLSSDGGMEAHTR